MSIDSIGSIGSTPPLRPTTPVGGGQAQPTGADAAAAPAVAPVPSQEQIGQAVKTINKALQSLTQDSVEFSLDGDRTIIKVIDQKTKDVIRQIPSAEALDIAKALDKVQGLLIKQTA